MRTEIAEYVQQGHSEGKWDKTIVFVNQSPPLFTLKLQKMKPPKPSDKTLAEEPEFLDYCHNLRSVIAIEILDGDYNWACKILKDYWKEGHLKDLVRRMASSRYCQAMTHFLVITTNTSDQ